MVGYQTVYHSLNLARVFLLSDLAVALAYYILTLMMFSLRNSFGSSLAKLTFGFISLLMFASGSTRLVQAWNIYHANYWTEAWVRAGHAFLSVLTVIFGLPVVNELRRNIDDSRR